ncbi:serine hydrolase domain-containing protein [Amycolatopsis taiwanensis]|uniref:Peptidase n=1 Tax=Amycolatopsis taiwanensis TaxID=342230 RepID=A0A9W6RB84_9PSEU|nr:serine hydrolase domain-containing protein [Amycolatopsis taiwanensis]GLY70922.1 peptidase [Amycolatopsis taiwanensis]
MKSTVTLWSTLAAAAVLTAALAVGTAAPAIAAAPGAGVSSSAHGTALPPLDPAAIRQALANRPTADVSGAFVQVTGSAGHFTGASGPGINPDGRFRIGSVSKVFTATVMLQLAAEGKVDLNGSVQHYLPGVLPAEFPPIQVGQLLNHTSGLPDGPVGYGDGTVSWFAAHQFDSWTPQQVVAGIAGAQMSFPPGTAQQYNGLNSFVAGLVIEKVTGHSYAHEVNRRIIGPLGLHDTSVPDADDLRLADAAAHPYLVVPDVNGGSHQVDVTKQSPWPWAEGGLISSAPDLSRFFNALFRGRLLPPAQQQLLFTVPDVPNHDSSHCETGPTPTRACLSMGLETVEVNGVVVWGKTGSRPGWTAGVFATRDLARTVVYMINPTGMDGAEAPYLYGIAAAAFGAGQQ